MGLWKKGELRLSIHTLETVRDQCKQEYLTSCDQEPIITDLIPLPEDHPDRGPREDGTEYFLIVEFEYNSIGWCAGYGITTDGKAHCFYS